MIVANINGHFFSSNANIYLIAGLLTQNYQRCVVICKYERRIHHVIRFYYKISYKTGSAQNANCYCDVVKIWIMVLCASWEQPGAELDILFA